MAFTSLQAALNWYAYTKATGGETLVARCVLRPFVNRCVNTDMDVRIGDAALLYQRIGDALESLAADDRERLLGHPAPDATDAQRRAFYRRRLRTLTRVAPIFAAFGVRLPVRPKKDNAKPTRSAHV